jgi:hypothetical protein
VSPAANGSGGLSQLELFGASSPQATANAASSSKYLIAPA